jgi:glycosyltransferase involved in cell wall biosynthesis
MNILIVIDTPGRGGAERVSFTLASWLDTHDDIHATIVALNESKKLSYPTEGIDYVNLNSRNVIWGIRKTVKQRNTDVVLTMTVPLCIYTVPALSGLNVKHVVSERNSPAHFAGKWTTKVMSRWLLKQADGFVFQTKQARDYYGGRIADRSVIIHNPICEMPDNLFKPVFERRKVIVSVGRLNKQKNHAMLIKAFADVFKEYPDYTLRIYGDGKERENLVELIRTLGLTDKVILAGTQSDVHKEIVDAAMFVMSSDFEGMPNALMEAMALGIPCISTDCPCGGPAELIENGKNGILVPVGDINAMTKSMKSILCDHNSAELLGREASLIKETHSADLICKMWLDYFNGIVYD